MDLKDLVAQPWENEQLYECLGDQMKEIKEEPTDSWKRADEPQPLEELEQMPKLEPMVERPSGPHIIKKFTCSLCSEKQLNYKIKEIQTENDKLVIIVGFLVCKYVELNQAVQLMESEAKLLVCNQHIPMVVDEILKLVGVQDHEQFPQNYAIQQLMTIVDSVQTSITAIQFWTMFNGFVHNVGKILEKTAFMDQYDKWKTNNNERIQIDRMMRVYPRHFCSLCCKMQFDSPTNEVALKEDKTVLMIGSLLLRELNRHQAHVFVETRRQKLFVCNFHFTNNVRVIFEFLGIKSIREAPKQEMMKRFMSTLNYFCPRMSSTEFMDSLGRFVRKYQVVVGRTETRAPASESLRQQSMKSHVVRPQVEDEEMKIIFYKTEKLVVFVGFILQGKYTLEQVQSFMDQERSLSIHRSDLRQMLRSIFDFLEIRNFRNINRYSIEKMDVLLPIVRSLNPGVSTPWQFCSVLSMFWARYQKEIELNSLFFK